MTNHNKMFISALFAAVAACLMFVNEAAQGAPPQNVVPNRASEHNVSAEKTIHSSPDKYEGLFEIPTAALVRPLGVIPPAPCTPQLSPVCKGAKPTLLETLHGGYPMSLAGLGIPLGGIGAGSFMVNQAGTFGPWNFGGGVDERWEVRVLPQAALHIREQVGNEQSTVKTLAIGGPQGEGKDGPIAGRSWGGHLFGLAHIKPRRREIRCSLSLRLD